MSKEGTLYTRVSERGLICLKSVAVINEPIDKIVDMLQDLDLKPKYDDNFESGHIIEMLPLETAILYYKYKKIMIVSPRDMIMLCKIHRVDPSEVYILA